MKYYLNVGLSVKKKTKKASMWLERAYDVIAKQKQAKITKILTKNLQMTVIAK